MAAMIGPSPMLMGRAMLMLRCRQSVFMTVLPSDAGGVRGSLHCGLVMHGRVPLGADRGFERSNRNRPHEQGGQDTDEPPVAEAFHAVNLLSGGVSKQASDSRRRCGYHRAIVWCPASANAGWVTLRA